MTGAAIVAAAVVTACALRLMAGPIDLDFLKPRFLTEFETPEGRVRVDADRLYAEWGGLREPMRVVVVGLHVTDAKKQEIATAPSVAFSFEPRSVMRGQLLPTAIVVDRPTLDAEIAREGGMLKRVLATSDASTQGEFVTLLIEQLLAEHNHHSLLGQLDTVEVVHARVSLRDVPSGVVWIAPNAQARLRRDAAGVAISASARFLSAASGEPIDVRLSGTYGRDRSRISVEAGIDGFKPSMLAQLSEDAALLRGLDIALSGRLRVEANGQGEIRTMTMEVTAGAGTITLPGVLPVPHKVRSVNARAHVDAATHTARIEHVDVDLGGPKISLKGTGLRTEKEQTFSGRAELKQVPIDRLGDYWPLEFAAGGRIWALANLSAGSVDIAGEFGLSVPGTDLSRLTVDRTVAFLDYRGLTVRYMPGMPELKNLSGKARYEGDGLRFDVAGATAAGLGVAGATVELTGLEGANQFASMRIPVTGPAPAAIALLAQPKLGLPRDALYDPKRLGGDVAIDLTLSFPLLNALAVTDIDVKAEAALSAFSLKGAIGAVDLTDAVAKLVYGGSQLAVTGTGKLDGSVVDIAWREQFAPRAPYRQRYELKGTLPATLIAKAGFPSPEPYVTGAIGVTSLVYQTFAGGTSDLQGRFDLKGAKVALAPIGWTKGAGTEGQLTLGLKFAAGAKLTTADIEGRGNGLLAKGQVRVGPDGTLQQISVGQFALGRTDIAGEWRRAAGGVEIAVRGRALELSRLRQALKGRDGAREHALHHPARPRPACRGQPRRRERTARPVRRAHDRCRDHGRRRQGCDRAHRARRHRAQPQYLCPRFRRALEGDRLARRHGRRLSRLPRPVRRCGRRLSAHRQAEGRALPPGTGDPARGGRHAQLGHRWAEPGRRCAPAVRRSRSVSDQDRRPHRAQGRPHVRQVDRADDCRGHRRGEGPGRSARYRRAGLRAQQPAVERAAARPAADRRQGRRRVCRLLSPGRPARRAQDRRQHDGRDDAWRAARAVPEQRPDPAVENRDPRQARTLKS